MRVRRKSSFDGRYTPSENWYEKRFIGFLREFSGDARIKPTKTQKSKSVGFYAANYRDMIIDLAVILLSLYVILIYLSHQHLHFEILTEHELETLLVLLDSREKSIFVVIVSKAYLSGSIFFRIAFREIIFCRWKIAIIEDYMMRPYLSQQSSEYIRIFNYRFSQWKTFSEFWRSDSAFGDQWTFIKLQMIWWKPSSVRELDDCTIGCSSWRNDVERCLWWRNEVPIVMIKELILCFSIW